jgi:DnaJ-domain-containing protein 1
MDKLLELMEENNKLFIERLNALEENVTKSEQQLEILGEEIPRMIGELNSAYTTIAKLEDRNQKLELELEIEKERRPWEISDEENPESAINVLNDNSKPRNEVLREHLCKVFGVNYHTDPKELIRLIFECLYEIEYKKQSVKTPILVDL